MRSSPVNVIDKLKLHFHYGLGAVLAHPENTVRGKKLNEKITDYIKSLNISDHQDLLAMVAFDSLIGTLKLEEETTQETQKITNQVESLTQLVEQALT